MQELRSKLLQEAEGSASANAEVAVRWGSVLQLNVPQDLFRAIEEQRIACEAVIASKDRLIAGKTLVTFSTSSSLQFQTLQRLRTMADARQLILPAAAEFPIAVSAVGLHTQGA